jgi:hypothetical protein
MQFSVIRGRTEIPAQGGYQNVGESPRTPPNWSALLSALLSAGRWLGVGPTRAAGGLVRLARPAAGGQPAATWGRCAGGAIPGPTWPGESDRHRGPMRGRAMLGDGDEVFHADVDLTQTKTATRGACSSPTVVPVSMRTSSVGDQPGPVKTCWLRKRGGRAIQPGRWRPTRP